MRVLIACEESQAVTIAFRNKGHEAYSCDLQECSGGHPEWHIISDVLKIIEGGFFNTENGDLYEIGEWDMSVMFPPCTDIAVSGSRSFEIKKADGRQDAALDFVRKLMAAPINKIALENPVSVISSKIRKPDQIIHPYYFGDNVPKKTCLWLKNLPPLFHAGVVDLFNEKITHVEPEYLEYNSAKTKSGKSRYSIFWKLGKGHGKERSKTFPGIAQAMAEQWG